MTDYHGPYTLNEIEASIGDFTRVLMKTVPPGVIPLEAGEQQLTTVGFLWDCGCEVRGTASPDYLPTCLWSPCVRHDHLHKPLQEMPETLLGDHVVPRALATVRRGHILVIRGDEIYQKPA